MCCTNDGGYDDRSINRARLVERVLGGILSGTVLTLGLVMVKVLGLA